MLTRNDRVPVVMLDSIFDEARSVDVMRARRHTKPKLSSAFRPSGELLQDVSIISAACS